MKNMTWIDELHTNNIAQVHDILILLYSPSNEEIIRLP
jgi:hypothetical protein